MINTLPVSVGISFSSIKVDPGRPYIIYIIYYLLIATSCGILPFAKLNNFQLEPRLNININLHITVNH